MENKEESRSSTQKSIRGMNFYNYCIKGCSAKIIDSFVEDDEFYKKHLEKLVSRTYEELKTKNVDLPRGTEYWITTKLIDARFFSTSAIEKTDNAISLKDIKGRILLVADLIKRLCDSVSQSTEEIVRINEIVFIGAILAKHIHILKSILYFTFDRLPWEEILFYLVVYISSIRNPKFSNDIYKLVLSDEAAISYLNNFRISLVTVEKSLSKLKGPVLKIPYKEMMAIVLRHNPNFEPLYKDYSIIRDVYSLNRIDQHLTLCHQLKSSNVSDISTAIERTLQVIGELFNKTPLSPNISEEVTNLLTSSAPKNFQELCIGIRHKLSHIQIADCINEHENRVQISRDILKEFENIQFVIRSILQKRRFLALEDFLKKIIDSKNCDEIENMVKIMKSIGYINENWLPKHKEVNDLKNCVKLLSNARCREVMSVNKKCLRLYDNLVGSCHILKDFCYDMPLVSTWSSIIYNKKLKNNIENIRKKCQTILTLLSLYENKSEFIKLQRYASVLINALASENLKPLSQEKLQNIIDMLLRIDDIVNRMQSIRTINNVNFKLSKKPWQNYANSIIVSYITKNETEDLEVISKFDNLRNLHLNKNELSSLLEKLEVNHDSDNGTNSSIIDKCQRIYETILRLASSDSNSSEFIEHLRNGRIKACKDSSALIKDEYGALVKKLLENKKKKKHKSELDLHVDVFIIFIKNLLVQETQCNEEKMKHTITEFVKDQYKIQLETLKTKLGYNNANKEECAEKFIEDDNLRMATEMILLNLLNILELLSFLPDNRFFFDDSSPILIGKSLRNYLAHGNPLIDALPFDVKLSVIANALKLLDEGEIIILEEKTIGQRPLKDLKTLHEDFDHTETYFNKQFQLFKTAQIGTVDEMRRLIDDNDADLLAHDARHWSLCHFAAYGGNTDTFDCIINLKLDLLYGKTNENQSPIDIAVQYNTAILLFLLENYDRFCHLISNLLFILIAGASLNGNLEMVKKCLCKFRVPHKMLSECLFHACKGNHFEITEYLVSKGADVNYSAKDVPPLNVAVGRGCLETVKVLIKHRAKINAATKAKFTPLYLACMYDHVDIVKILLSEKAKVYNDETINNCPVFITIENNNIDILRILLDNGIDMRRRTGSHSYAPIHYSALLGHCEIIELLLEAKNNKVDINCQNSYKRRTPLMVATIQNNLHVVELLVRKKAAVDLEDDDGSTALIFAAKHGFDDIAALLIDNGADVNVISAGSSPLCQACYSGNISTVKLLLDEKHKIKANVNLVDKEGLPPIFIAAYEGYNDIIKILIQADARVDMKINNGLTLCHYGVMSKNVTAVETILKKSGAIVNEVDDMNCPPINVAACKGSPAMIDLLIVYGARTHIIDKEGHTILHYAVFSNDVITVRKILQMDDCNINAINKLGLVPLAIAVANGFSQIVDVLITHGAFVKEADISRATPEQYPHREIISPLHLAFVCGYEELVQKLLQNF